jgi:hypothetical protein
LQDRSEYTFDNMLMKLESEKKMREEEIRRHVDQATRPNTDGLG